MELVKDMTKPEVPRAIILFTLLSCKWKDSFFSFRIAFWPVRNLSTQQADKTWEMTVAIAAPLTPIFSLKMKIGSRIMLASAPRITVIIPIRPKPWALIKGFMPRLIMTKMLPRR